VPSGLWILAWRLADDSASHTGQPFKAAMARLTTLDCGEARFTALGETLHLAPTAAPISRPPEPGMAGIVGHHVGTCQPFKAAMARRSPKRARNRLATLDRGEARFTALGETLHLAPTAAPISRPPEPGMAGIVGHHVGTCQPFKAAMARRSPKRARNRLATSQLLIGTVCGLAHRLPATCLRNNGMRWVSIQWKAASSPSS